MIRTSATRRSLTVLTSAALLTGAAPAKALPSDDVLLARVEDFVAYVAKQRAELAAMPEDERAIFHAYGRKLAREGIATGEDRMAAAIAKLPARTPEGLRAKARAAVWQAGGDDTALPRILNAFDVMGSLLADLTKIPRKRKEPRA